MKTYRKNALMAGMLYFLGSLFGISSAFVGGEVVSSIVKTSPLKGGILLDIIASEPWRLLGGSFLVLLMGIALVAMTAFLYPLFRKDSEELAMGMLLFRGAMEGAWYFMTAVSMLVLFALSAEYTAGGSAALLAAGNAVYRFQDLLGPVGSIFFLIGAACLYISFYRTRLIPRWLSLWGLTAVAPYMAYAVLHLFGLDSGFGVWLQMPLAVQEIVMAFWLIAKGFDLPALRRLTASGQAA